MATHNFPEYNEYTGRKMRQPKSSRQAASRAGMEPAAPEQPPHAAMREASASESPVATKTPEKS